MFSIAETFTFLAAAAANALPDGHLPGLGRPPVSLDFAGCHVSGQSAPSHGAPAWQAGLGVWVGQGSTGTLQEMQ